MLAHLSDTETDGPFWTSFYPTHLPLPITNTAPRVLHINLTGTVNVSIQLNVPSKAWNRHQSVVFASCGQSFSVPTLGLVTFYYPTYLFNLERVSDSEKYLFHINILHFLIIFKFHSPSTRTPKEVVLPQCLSRNRK